MKTDEITVSSIPMNRPYITAVLAMTADGKISDHQRSPFRLGSPADKSHLEARIAESDATLFGSGTLRAYQTTLRITQPDYLAWRISQEKPPQPIHIVCSHAGHFDPHWPFFAQPVPRWLLTSNPRLTHWQTDFPGTFEKILLCQEPSRPQILPKPHSQIPWALALKQLKQLGIEKLTVLGGGNLVSTFVENHFLDELWLTICPFLVGGENAPSLMAGQGLPLSGAKTLHLNAVKTVDQEVFLHYLCRESVLG